MRTRPRLLAAALLGAASATAGIALTATSGWLIVRASERPVILTLLTAVVAVRTFGIARPVLRYAERLRSHDAALADLAARRAATYARLVPLTPARLGRRRRADLLAGVVEDLTDVVEAQVRVTVPVLTAAVAGGLTAILTALVAPAVGLTMAALLLGAAVLCVVAWRLELGSQHDLLGARAEVTRVSQLVGGQAPSLHAVGALDAAGRWLDDAHAALRAATERQSRGRALVSGGLLALVGAATVVVAGLVAGLVAGPDLPVAVKGLLVLVPVAVGDALLPLVDAVRALARSQGAATRLEGLLAQKPAVTDTPGTAPPGRVLPRGREASGVRLTLQGARGSWTGVDSSAGPVDLDLQPGSRVLLTGPNGGGKSTLLALLARHLELAGGRYLVDGVDVRTLPLAHVRGLVAVVDDEPYVLATTLRENLRLALPLSVGTRSAHADPAVDRALTGGLQRAGLGPWLAALPHGLDTRLGAGGRGMSGGERARLAIARAIVSNRPVILLDEPVAHLDQATASEVLDDLLRAADGRTVVLVSHQPVAAERFDFVLEVGASVARVG